MGAAAHCTKTRSSSVDHLQLGLPARSQFSAGAKKEPSARKITSRQLFHSQRVSFSHASSSLMPPVFLGAALRLSLPSPSTMHSRSISWPSGHRAIAVQPERSAYATHPLSRAQSLWGVQVRTEIWTLNVGDEKRRPWWL